MRLIKAVLFGLVGLFIIITLLSLLIPSTVVVSRATVINGTSIKKLLAQTTDLKNWKNWHPAFKSDSVAKSFTDGPAGKSSAAAIVYNQKTTDLIITAVEDSSVQFSLRSPGENEIDNRLMFTTVSNTGSIKVEWLALNKLQWYPWQKFYAIFLDKISGPGYETALAGLKSYMER